MLLATALALLITGCAHQTFTVQNKTGSSSNSKETITPSFFCFCPVEETVDGAKICGCQKMLLKQKPVQTFVNGLLGFITLGIYTPPGSACVLLNNNCMSCPSIWKLICTAQLVLYFWVPSVVFA